MRSGSAVWHSPSRPSPLTPSAVELDSPPARMLIRFETTPAAAEQQAAAACDLCKRHEAPTTVLQGVP